MPFSGIGIVQEVGAACKNLKIGDRVGWGYAHSTCGSCASCLSGNEVYCPKAEMYGEAAYEQGSLSSLVVRKEQWLFKISDSMTSEDAAPLMCMASFSFYMPFSTDTFRFQVEVLLSGRHSSISANPTIG